MQPIERQPVEVRKAYAIAELKKIVDESETARGAKQKCRQRLIELVDQGVVRSAQEDVLEIKSIVSKYIEGEFVADRRGRIRNRKKDKETVVEGNLSELEFQRAESMRLQRNYKGALEAYQSAFNLDPSSSEYAFMLGLAFYHSLSFGEATDYLLKAVELSDHCQAIFYHWLLDAALLSGRGRSIAKNVTNMIENRNIDGGDKEKIKELINEINIKGLMPGVIWVAERIAGGVFPSEFSGFKR